MKVILQADIKNVGKKGQILDASDGYARNYLLPKKLAVIADSANMNELKTKQEANKYRRDMSMQSAKELQEKMKKFEITFKIKSGENGKTFGSITSKDIADELISLNGIETSFVLVDMGEFVNISGRSNGSMNVQVVLEKLGGGGHQTIAGAQLSNMSMEQAKQEVIKAINKTIEENQT